MEPTYGDYDPTSIDGLDELIARMRTASDARDWSFILGDYISWGNNKIDKSVAIFNLNAATDCPNADTDRCQVPWESCYAHKAEGMYPQVLPYRRKISRSPPSLRSAVSRVSRKHGHARYSRAV